MSIPRTPGLERIYIDGYQLPDFVGLKPNSVLVDPIKPPDRIGSIHAPGAATDIFANQAILYRVLTMGPVVEQASDALHQPGTVLRVKPGDVVALRNGMAEPIHANRNTACRIDVAHIMEVIDPDVAAESSLVVP